MSIADRKCCLRRLATIGSISVKFRNRGILNGVIGLDHSILPFRLSAFETYFPA